jgi:hypothetical protein
MNSDSLERRLFILEDRANDLERSINAASIAARQQRQAGTRLRQQQAFMSVQRTIYGQYRIPAIYTSRVRVLGCNAGARSGATVTIASSTPTNVTAVTGSDGYAYWDHGNAGSTSSITVSAGDNYAAITSAAVPVNDLASTTSIQTLAATNYICLNNCTAPVRVQGQKFDIGGNVGTLSTFSAGVASGSVTISNASIRRAVKGTGNNQYFNTGPVSGAYTVTVEVQRASGGHLAVTVRYKALTSGSTVIQVPIDDDITQTTSGNGFYLVSNRAPVVNGSTDYTCTTLTGTVDFSATVLPTELGFSSVTFSDP